jgi:DNA-binding NarL/FixJ family response regulator
VRKILIVDDNEYVRRCLRYCIEQNQGWQVCGEAEDGKMALEMVSRLRPDLVTLDLSMPVMNGLEAAKEISKIAPEIPMVMFTMYADAVREEAERAGIRHVFSKTKGFGNDVIAKLRTMLSA